VLEKGVISLCFLHCINETIVLFYFTLHYMAILFVFSPSGGDFEPFESAQQLQPVAVVVPVAQVSAKSDMSNFDLLGGLDAPVPMAPSICFANQAPSSNLAYQTSLNLDNQTSLFPGTISASAMPQSVQVPTASAASNLDLFDLLPSSGQTSIYGLQSVTSNVHPMVPLQSSNVGSQSAASTNNMLSDQTISAAVDNSNTVCILKLSFINEYSTYWLFLCVIYSEYSISISAVC